MSRKKDNYKWIGVVLAIAALIVLVIGGKSGWFKSVINVPTPNQSLTVTPIQQAPAYSTCSQVCSQQGFSQSYSSDTCKAGESKITYGYPNQAPILTCCCYNLVTPTPTPTPIPTPTPTPTEPRICYDSDISLEPFEEQLKFAGFCTDSSGTYSDYCYEGTDHLVEYYCGPLASPIETQTCLGPGGSFNCPGMIPGSHCDAGRCVMGGGGTMTDAECQTWMSSLGKQFWDNDNLDTIDSCEMLVWFHCQSIGKTLLYFDYNEGCCVWSCT